MPTDLAELSSISSSLEQITRRIAVMAERASEAGDETVAVDLFGVERSLQGAARRLDRILGNH